MTKYGIAHSTIRYYQKEADSLVRMVGSAPIRSMASRIENDHQRMSARELGHLAISVAQYDASLLRIASPALPTMVTVEATELLTEAERAQVVRVAQLSASLDVMEQLLVACFPGRLVYRGGSHVALLAFDGGPRILIVTEQAPEPLLAIRPTVTELGGHVRQARDGETPEQFSVYQQVWVGAFTEARWVADFDHLQDARAFVQKGGR
jgi:hypothetical protein